MFISPPLGHESVGGREQLSRLIGSVLSDVFDGRFHVFEFDDTNQDEAATVIERLNGHIDGATTANIDRVIEAIGRLGVRRVILNGSNLGAVARRLHSAIPKIEITTFFHNCEARFFAGALRHEPSIRALGVLIANFRSERLSVRFSDKIICLNERDSDQLRRSYGRGATHLLPLALRDQLPQVLPLATTHCGRYALFVGGTFYANRQGIDWFVDNIAAVSPIKTYVVGKGFEAIKGRLERNGNVEVIGGVASLVPWYLGAHVVIAPIFDGSGMKTKVAEALMFGRRVVGTPEAFVGYEAIIERAGVVCESPAEFLAALERESQRPFTGIDLELRAAYEDRYSYRAAREQLARILGA